MPDKEMEELLKKALRKKVQEEVDQAFQKEENKFICNLAEMIANGEIK